MSSCAGCKQEIVDRERMKCHICKHEYDLTCANVSEKRFNLFFHPCNQQPKEWKCPNCVCKQPKKNNDNTPIRSSTLPATELQPDEMNITMRRQPKKKIENASFSVLLNEPNESNIELTQPINENMLGDTIVGPQQDKDWIIGQISELLDAKLLNYNSLIISNIKSEIKTLVHQEIQLALKDFKAETNSNIDTINSQQGASNQEIGYLLNKIKDIEGQLSILKEQTGNTTIPPSAPQKLETPTLKDHTRTLILYGLDQPTWEDENELYKRIAFLFHDILDVNIDGYIDDLRRLGRRGNRNPISIDLISTRMTKFILANKQHFRAAGLTLSHFLDDDSLKQRKTLVKILREARKEGKHAVIRNNRLLINGKIHHDICSHSDQDRVSATSATIKNPTTIQNSQPPTSHDINTHSDLNDNFRN